MSCIVWYCSYRLLEDYPAEEKVKKHWEDPTESAEVLGLVAVVDAALCSSCAAVQAVPEEADCSLMEVGMSLAVDPQAQSLYSIDCQSRLS
jgi:hypothetical protein